jgi:hypothetical protein
MGPPLTLYHILTRFGRQACFFGNFQDSCDYSFALMVDRLYSHTFAMAVWSTVETRMITWAKKPPLQIPVLLSNSMFRILQTQISPEAVM